MAIHQNQPPFISRPSGTHPEAHPLPQLYHIHHTHKITTTKNYPHLTLPTSTSVHTIASSATSRELFTFFVNLVRISTFETLEETHLGTFTSIFVYLILRFERVSPKTHFRQIPPNQEASSKHLHLVTMAVEIIPQLNQMTISESQWTIVSGTEESTHENGNYESAATSSQTSCASSVAGSSNSSFSSISGPEMPLPKSIVKKRRVGLDIDESYGKVTLEDHASEGAITDEETDDYAKFEEGEISFIDLGEFDADDESSDKDSDEDLDEDSNEEGSDGGSIADSYQGG